MTTETAPISEREREILRLVATGATNQQIAQSLNISVNTVKVHLRNIFGKIGATSRTEATVYAMRAGLVDVGLVNPEAIDAAPQEIPAPELVSPAIISQPTPPEAASAVPVEVPPEAPPVTALPEAPPMVVSPAEPMLAPRVVRPVLLVGGVLVALALLAVVWFVGRTLSGANTAATPTTIPVVAPGESWQALAAMPKTRSAFGLASYESDGRQYIYTLAGTVEGQPSGETLRYDTQNDQWNTLTAKPTAVTDVHAAVVGRLIYVPGGTLASGQPTDVLEAYDQQADRWMTLANMPAPRSGYALSAFEGKLYLFGGWDGSEHRAEVWSYSPDTDTWTTLQPMPTVRAFADAVVVGQEIYVVGGENASGPLAVNERYTPANESASPWVTRLPMPQAASRIAIGITTAGERQLYVFGLENAGNQHLVYEVARDSWKAVPLPAPIASDARVVSVENQLYILGGDNSAQAFVYKPVYILLLPAISN